MSKNVSICVQIIPYQLTTDIMEKIRVICMIHPTPIKKDSINLFTVSFLKLHSKHFAWGSKYQNCAHFENIIFSPNITNTTYASGRHSRLLQKFKTAKRFKKNRNYSFWIFVIKNSKRDMKFSRLLSVKFTLQTSKHTARSI